MQIVYPPPPNLPSLGEPAPVSQCPLWKIQEDYYRNQGPEAWNQQIPYYTTNSVVAAQAYAELILAFVRDLGPDPEGRPLTILEIGSGLGRLGFLLCRELERQRRCFAATRKQPIRVILTDITDNNVQFWEGHASMAPYVEQGLLDFAVYHPGRDASLRLRRSGETIEPGSLALPLVAIANYVFDSLPQDEFQVRFRRLLECKLQLFRAAEPIFSDADRTDIRDVFWHRTYKTVQTDYYPNPSWNALLEHYLKKVTLGGITIPVGALSCIDKLRTFSSAGMMLIASDKGYTSLASMASFQHHEYHVHSGCFAHMVNFHALGQTFDNYLHTSHTTPDGVQTMVGISLPGGRQEFENVEYSFREHLDRESRLNATSKTLPLVCDDQPDMKTARGLVAFLRQNLCDPNILAAAGKRLLETIRILPPEERGDLMSLLEESWETFFPFPGAVQLPFWVAHIYGALERPDKALEYFDRALAITGEQGYLHRFRAETLEVLGRPEEAAVAHRRALELDPSLADLQY